MKVVFCPICEDFFRVHAAMKHCSCNKSSGRLDEDLKTLVVKGNAIPCGINNQRLRRAVQSRPSEGKGHIFDGFVFPVNTATVRKE